MPAQMCMLTKIALCRTYLCNAFEFSAALVCLLLDFPLRQSDMSMLKSMKLIISFQNEAEGEVKGAAENWQ